MEISACVKYVGVNDHIGKAGGRAGRDDRGPAPGSAGIWLPARGRV